MGKGGTILGLIGILLGAGSLGFAFIIWIQPTYTPGEIWHRYYEDIYDVADATYQPIPNMTLSIELSKSTPINLLFTCQAQTIGNEGRSDLTFQFYIDEVVISNPNCRVGTFNGNDTSYFHSVSLYYFIESMSFGAHSILVYVGSTVSTNFIQYCALTVQSLPS